MSNAFSVPCSLREALSMGWKFLNTNACPRCGRRVYKDGGCPSMVCPSPCNRHFVWASPWLWMANIASFLGAMSAGSALATSAWAEQHPIAALAPLAGLQLASLACVFSSAVLTPMSSREIFNVPFVAAEAISFLALWGPLDVALARTSAVATGAFASSAWSLARAHPRIASLVTVGLAVPALYKRFAKKK